MLNEKQSVVVTWKPSPESDIANYTIHYGTSSGVYDHKLVVGIPQGKTKPDTTATIDDLEINKTYYFAYTATNKNGIISGLSDETNYLNAPKQSIKENQIVKIPSTPADDPRLRGNYIESMATKDANSIRITVTAADMPGKGDNIITMEESQDLQNWTPVHQETFSGLDSAGLLKFQYMATESGMPPKNFFRFKMEEAKELGKTTDGSSIYKIPTIPSDDPRINGNKIESEIHRDSRSLIIDVTAADLPGDKDNRVTLQKSKDCKSWETIYQIDFPSDVANELLKFRYSMQTPENTANVDPKLFFRAGIESIER